MDEELQKGSSLHIGPAGWSYADWTGKVYPVGGRIDGLEYISRYFSCIELNSSFYRIPRPGLVSSWVTRLSGKEGFLMTVKLHRSFSHERDVSADRAGLFLDTFRPLEEAGLLGAYLLQFPWSFRKDDRNMGYLDSVARRFSGRPLAVEVRHGSWDSPETARFFKNSGIALCSIDQPLIGSSLAPSELVTIPDFAYIRLHGRNYGNWFKSDAGRDDRYDYLYRDSELEEWKGRAAAILSAAKKVFLITNNHFQGQSLVNALQLRAMIEGGKVDVPPVLAANYPFLSEIDSGGGFRLES